MLSRNRAIVRSADTTNRTSTGIDYPPSIPVDGVDRANARISSDPAASADNQPVWSAAQLSSLELLRQLETCVRELLEVNAKGR
jgi:hypothetical protein